MGPRSCAASPRTCGLDRSDTRKSAWHSQYRSATQRPLPAPALFQSGNLRRCARNVSRLCPHGPVRRGIRSARMIRTWEIREQADRKALARLLACLEQTLGWEPDHAEREIAVRSERGDDFVRALEKCNEDWEALLMPPNETDRTRWKAERPRPSSGPCERLPGSHLL